MWRRIQERGRINSLIVCCYWTEAESDIEKHSVFFVTTYPIIPEPAFRAFLSQQPDSWPPDTGSWGGGLV